MRKRVVYGSGIVLLAILAGLVIWQGSFDFGDFGPSSPEQTFMLWAVSTLIFILTITLGFMLTRNFIKLYVERHSNREGSRIRTKLVLGALALTFTPVVFLVIFSINVVNRNIDKWFSRPAEDIRFDLIAVGKAIDQESRDKAITLADWLASLPESERARSGDQTVANSFQQLCIERKIAEVRVRSRDGGMVRLCKVDTNGKRTVDHQRGDLVVSTIVPVDLARTQVEIHDAISRYDQLAVDKRAVRRSYLLLLTLITLFILFFATWLALFLAKQISVPISALLGAAQEVRKGNLDHRVQVNAMDELASLVRAFNEMTQELGANSRELDKRRRFTEAILESIPTGVLSLSSDGKIQRVNRALKGLLPAEQVERATRLQDLFSADDTAEIRYLMNRARRMGVAASQFDIRTDQRVLHLSATVAALDDKINSGFVLVLEDTSDMLRAQKAAAWHEIARRIAHELKNPLTPIALCAERISRQLDKPGGSDKERILRECSAIILSEVETVRTLVDEFSQFSRFPSAQPVPSDLNDVVESALAVFGGRLDNIEVIKRLDAGLPQVNLDREQFKRLVVNLIDNAAEALRESLVKRLYIGTSMPTLDLVELTIADTGTGISPEDKERLFLPYFTTKSRGTGLGLAIVSHIVSEHRGQIRVEDNSPVGARFIIELTALAAVEAEVQAVGAPA
jgi:two-component system, NtrC family, nitrogen regulation sensor histidine kinase NtrY